MTRCHRDCFNCPFPDCIDGSITPEETQASAERDLAVLRGRKVKDRKEYHHAYYEAHKKEQNALQRKKYAEDPEYREYKKEQNRRARKIYYQKHREEILAQKKAENEVKRIAREIARAKREAYLTRKAEGGAGA